MGLEEVKEELLKAGQSEVNQLRHRAEAEIKEFEAQMKSVLKSQAKESQESLKREFEHLSAVREAEARSEASHLLLKKKRELIDSAIKEAKDRLGSETLKALLKKAEAQINVAKVYCRKEDVKSLSHVKTVPAEITGGLIAENEDGTVSLNYTYDTLLARVLETKLQEIAECLFK